MLTVASSLNRNQSWDDNLRLFSLKIGWDLARAFLMLAMLTVLPSDFLNSGGDSNYNIGGHLHCFSSFTALREECSWFCDIFLSAYNSLPMIFFLQNFLQPGREGTTKTLASFAAWTWWGSGIWGGLICSAGSTSDQNRWPPWSKMAVSVIIVFTEPLYLALYWRYFALLNCFWSHLLRRPAQVPCRNGELHCGQRTDL